MRTILNINKDWSFVKNFAEVPAEIPAEAEGPTAAATPWGGERLRVEQDGGLVPW